MPKISAMSMIDPSARLADDVEVGPFCHIGADVVIGPRTKLVSHVSINGPTVIGADNVFYPHCAIGGAPQDLKYKGAPTRLEIGDGNLFREGVTIHRGTEKGGGVTKVGNQCFVMVNVHIGHDALIGNKCIMANNVMIAGHVHVGHGVNMAGGAAFHHFVTVGDFAFIGGYARIHHDVPPFLIVDGKDEVRGVNKVGLSRNGCSEEDIDALVEAVRELFPRRGTRAIATVLDHYDSNNGINPNLRKMIDFLRRRDEGRHGRYLESLRKK